MEHEKGTLFWDNCTKEQARGVLTRNGIAGSLFGQARSRFLHPSWNHGPHIYVIDTRADKGARIDNQGAETYSVKVSSRTGNDLFDDLMAYEEGYGPGRIGLVDTILILG